MEKQNLTSNRGGKREGAGRPKGAVQKAPKKKYDTTFQARCSFEQHALLSAYWKTIKHLN